MADKSTSRDWDNTYLAGRDVWTMKTCLPRFLEGLESRDQIYIEFLRKRKKAGTATEPSDFNVLSIGCGEGYFEEAISRHMGFTVRAIDVSEVAIEEARKKVKRTGAIPRLRYEAVDFLKVPDERIWPCHNLVIDWTTFHHINPQQHKLYKNKLLQAIAPYGNYALCHASDTDVWFVQEPEKHFVTGDSGMPLYRNSPEDIVKLFSPELRLQRFETSTFEEIFHYADELKEKPIGTGSKKFDQYLFRRR